MTLKPLWETRLGKGRFLRALPQSARLLDVGCGNNSPLYAKSVRPDLYYIGLDISDYNQSNEAARAADEYRLAPAAGFAAAIAAFDRGVDAVVSSHNLEHCDDPDGTLDAIARALRPGGRLFLSFPCEASVRFPRGRRGSLNFFDDATHKRPPPWDTTLARLRASGLVIRFTARRYRPFPLALAGLIGEPLSAWRKETLPNGATWALYGFESVI